MKADHLRQRGLRGAVKKMKLPIVRHVIPTKRPENANGFHVIMDVLAGASLPYGPCVPNAYADLPCLAAFSEGLVVGAGVTLLGSEGILMTKVAPCSV